MRSECAEILTPILSFEMPSSSIDLRIWIALTSIDWILPEPPHCGQISEEFSITEGLNRCLDSSRRPKLLISPI